MELYQEYEFEMNEIKKHQTGIISILILKLLIRNVKNI